MNVYALAPLFSVVIYAILAYFALRHPRRREREAFALYMASAGLWSLISLLLHLNEPLLNKYALPGSRLLVIGFIWMVATYYSFVRAFVYHTNLQGRLLAYGSVLLVALLAVFGWLPYGARSVNGVLFIEHGWSLYLLAAASVGLAGHAGYLLVHHYRSSTDSVTRNRIAYLLVGLGVVAAAGFTNFNGSLVKYPVDHLGNLINAGIIGYAIRRHQLLQIRFAIRRGLVYSVISVALVAAYLLLLFSLQSTLLSLTRFPSLLLASLLAIVLAALFTPLRQMAEEQVEKLLYRDTHRYRTLMLGFSSQMSGVLDLQQLAQGMLQTVTTGLGVRWAGLLFPDPSSGDFRLQFGKNDAVNWEKELRLRSNGPLVSWCISQRSAFRVETLEQLSVVKGMRTDERELLATKEVAVLCPIVCADTLSSLLVLGPKDNQTAYSNEQLELITTMANGVAVAIENARRLDSLHKQQQRAEQLLEQLVAAQEEERQRVASELHDGVAQWLVRISYEIQITSAQLGKENGVGVKAELGQIERTLSTTIKELRQVLAALKPPALEDLGLVHAISDEVDRLKRDGVNATLEIVGALARLPNSVELAAYRIVQESLNNVRKHSEAEQASVKIEFREHGVHIEISDNGKGFDVSKALEGEITGRHLGLWGMKKRAQALGGNLTIHGDPGVGSTIRLDFPVEPASVVVGSR